MNAFSTVLIILMVLLLGVAGYYYLDRIVPMQRNYEQVQDKNKELAFQIEQLERRLDEKSRETSEKVEEINQIKDTYEDLVGGLKEQVEKGEITITRMADQLNVKIVDRIIFPSGKAELSPDGIQVIKRVGDILNNAQDRFIKVEGHTDNVPIHPNLQDVFPTNWELSVTRATNVVRFLQDEVGIDPKRLEAAGRSEYKPIASNKNSQGRMRNRRIEIQLLPNPAAISQVKQATMK